MGLPRKGFMEKSEIKSALEGLETRIQQIRDCL